MHGFEIMPAPFVIAHMQVGLLLDELNAPLAEQGQHTSQRAEFVSIKLTNALTDWDETYDRPGYLPIPAIQDERDEAREIKRREEILVVLGNPPLQRLCRHGRPSGGTRADRALPPGPPGPGAGGPGPQRPLRPVLPHRGPQRSRNSRAAASSASSPTTAGWTASAIPGCASGFLDVFDRIWIDSLNGDKYRTGKTTPDGRPDPSIFSVPANREGIQVGTAIGLLVRRGERPAGSPPAEVRYRDFWGTDKRQQLMAALEGGGGGGGVRHCLSASVDRQTHSFAGLLRRKAIFAYPLLSELFDRAYPGVKTSRDEFLVDIDVRSLEIRIKEYFDQSIELRINSSGISIGYEADSAIMIRKKTRMRLLRSETARVEIVRYCYRAVRLSLAGMGLGGQAPR